jgi:lysozyme
MNTAPYNPSLISGGIVDVFHEDNDGLPIDWTAVARPRTIRAVIAKASQGTGMVDNQWSANWAGGGAAGLLVGAYHFCTADDPDAQVEHFLSVVGDVTGVLLALDWEAPDPDNPTFEPATVALVQQRAGRLPVIYTGRAMLSEPSAALSACPLWLAEYGTDPVCPPGWSRWRLHQYSDAVSVAGISGHVDMSVHDDTQGSLADLWAQYAGPPRPAPPPTPNPAPLPPPSPLTVQSVIALLQSRSFVESLQATVGAGVDGVMGAETCAKIAAYKPRS